MSDSDDLSTRGLETTWTGAGHTFNTETAVVQPSERDLARYGAPTTVCGNCRHFDIGDIAREKIRRERFYERLVREEGWKVKHLCSHPADLGLCGLSNGDTLTGRLHKGCDQYRPSNGLIRISQKARK